MLFLATDWCHPCVSEPFKYIKLEHSKLTETRSSYSGFIGDWLVLKLARRNGGVMESEQRLWLFSLSALLVPGGLILWGVGAAHGIHWFGVVFAMGFIGFTTTVGAVISINYCIDSYRELSGEAIVTVILIRNTMSFAIGYRSVIPHLFSLRLYSRRRSLTPWVTNMGLQDAFIVAAFAGLAQVLSFLVMIKYGRSLRQASAGKYRRYTEEMKAAGLVH